MRWLQWSTIDLKKGLGGVEVHARSLAREFEKMGIEAAFSMDPADLDSGDWDVIHTHGSAPAPKGASAAVRVHTLHGTTLGRMWACQEMTWPGGYAAELRELMGVLRADVVLSVHPGLSLYALAGTLAKIRSVCWNGWDPADLPGVPQSLSEGDTGLRDRIRELGDFWLFVGRGADRMKGADRLKGAIPLLPNLKWVAAPGQGFEEITSVTKTGPLSSAQVRELMTLASGLVLPSRYEGNSLVLLEALAQGLPIVATPVGAVPVLPKDLEGLIVSDANDPRAFADAIRAAQRLPADADSRARRAEKNRSILPTWSKVAEICVEAVGSFRNRRSHG